jgi:hypothetical protein
LTRAAIGAILTIIEDPIRRRFRTISLRPWLLRRDWMRKAVPMVGERTKRQWWLPVVAGMILAMTTVACDESASLTQAGTSVEPTPTLKPTPEPTADISDCTLGAVYQADVTIPDNTKIDAGQEFTKTWRIKNTGTCDWGAGYRLEFIDGDQMGGPGFTRLPETPAGETSEVSVSLFGPAEQGLYRGYWQTCVNQAKCFGDKLFVQVASTGEGPADPMASPTPSSVICSAQEVDAYSDEASATVDRVLDLLALTDTTSRKNLSPVADEAQQLQAELEELAYPACLAGFRSLVIEAIDELVRALRAYAAGEPGWEELMDEGQLLLVKAKWEKERVLEEEITR